MNTVTRATPLLTPFEYQQLVRRLHGAVMRSVPAGATLLVVSKGDDELVTFENRDAWHFPRAANGQYAGYHPASSEEALAHLEQMRGHGAEYLVVPAPSFWWFDHYSELADHLWQSTAVVRDDDVCVIFALSGDLSLAGGQSQDGTHGLVQAIRPLLDALLPKESRVAVISSGDPGLLALGKRKAVHFPQDERGRYSAELDGGTPAALGQLAAIRRDGTGVLVVPHIAPSWLDACPGFLAEVARRHRRLAHREYVCSVYELAADESSDPDESVSRQPLLRRILGGIFVTHE